jgi:hypothetical protein
VPPKAANGLDSESFVEKLMISSHRVGELAAKPLQLESPDKNIRLKVEPVAEAADNSDRAM